MKLIGRNRFLFFMFVAYIAVALRFGMPWLNAYLAVHEVMPEETIAIPLSGVYPMLVAYLGIFTGAGLMGTLIGFVLLDEKPHHTLTAMAATAVPLGQYALYRVGLPTVLAFVMIAALVLIINQALAHRCGSFG